MPRHDHSQLLTTLRDVATSAATIFGVLAAQQEATATPSASPPPSRDEDGDGISAAMKDPEPSPDYCVLCGSSARIEVAMNHRICESCIHASALELVYQQQRDAAAVWVNSIGQRLTDLLVLAQGAVKSDGLRTLPILDLALDQLVQEYSNRLGLFSLADPCAAPRADATIIALAGNAP